MLEAHTDARPRAPTAAYPSPAPRALRSPTLERVLVETVDSELEFAGCAAEWERLHEEAASASIFNAWAWQFAWWGIYGAQRPLCILVARQGGAMAGILPLYADSTEVLGLRLRTLRLVGYGGDTSPDDLGPLLARGKERIAARALAEAALRIPGVHALDLTDLDPASPFPMALAEAASAAGMRCVHQGTQRIAYLDLPSRWTEYLEAVGTSRRRELRYQRNRLASAHAMRLFVWDDAKHVDAALERLAALHRTRWGDLSRSFATPEYLAIQLRAMEEWAARGALRLYCLELDGRPAAMAYCCRFRRRVYMLQAGFDPAYAKYSPGNVLLGYALEHAIEEGNDAFDFLRGDHAYKDRLATAYRSTLSLTIYSSSVAGAALHARRALAHRLRRAAHSLKGNGAR